MEDLKFREATMEDLEAVVELLHSDKLGTLREQTTDLTPYQRALKEIIADANNHVLVAIIGDRVVGTVQLTFIRNLTFKGGLRAQIEGVRVAADLRGKGIGKLMLEYSVELAKKRDCHMVQLTSNKSRPEALRFYEQLGFKPTHEGFKMELS